MRPGMMVLPVQSIKVALRKTVAGWAGADAEPTPMKKTQTNATVCRKAASLDMK